jgi:DNA-binding NarL/FixJ family response regulator
MRRGGVTVAVVDADPLARRQIVDLLRSSGRFTIVAEARDGGEGLELARHYRPDILLCEAASPGNGARRRYVAVCGCF